jgi:HEAT repeat protein
MRCSLDNSVCLAYNAKIETIKELHRKTIESVQPGEMQPERDHHYAREHSRIGTVADRAYRDSCLVQRDAIPDLIHLTTHSSPFVRQTAAEALHYIGTEQAKDALIKHLFNTRWCASTTPESTFYP